MIEEKEIVRYLDQTNLHPNATTDEISKFIKEAKESNFYGVAIMPSWIPLAADILKGSNTRIVAAIGFPVGTGTTLYYRVLNSFNFLRFTFVGG